MLWSCTFWIWSVILVEILGSSSGTPDTPLEENAWALLVAGSKGLWNYRHQADICHSYHVMIAEGIPAHRIIVMMYDDIVNHPENPTPGKLINKPNGTDVYAGVKIDYRGKDVNPKNFLNILKGNRTELKGIGSGRVIESDENTNIFVYFADHGGALTLNFPDASLYADDLQHTLDEMFYTTNRYNKVIMYIEACFSGSMFEGILEEYTRVFVMTAAARDESSYLAYCNLPQYHNICLGDAFSVSWLERMDKEGKGTFDQFFHQYQGLRIEVRESHVQIYGDFSIGPNAMTPNNKELISAPEYLTTSVSARDVELFYRQHKVSAARDMETKLAAQKDYDNLVEGRKIADELMEAIVTTAVAGAPHLRNAVNGPFCLLI
uniref:legumain n=1 Tax=Lygus hesperus TaxID=30085 RepID=A0A0A9W6A0_LYGHE